MTGIPLLQDLDPSPEMTGRQMRVAERHLDIAVAGQRCDFRDVVPRLNSGQFIEHCKPSILQRIQTSSILHFSRDIRVHSLNILLKRPRLSSAPMGFE